jgi:flagellar hook-length control protein FliK
MERMSTIPAPVDAMISGNGSFFGSCQMAANNFEPFFQSAMAGNTASTMQGFATSEQHLFAEAGNEFKTFSEALEGYGENKVLERLKEILGEEAGTEAFELACMAAQNGDVLGNLSLEDQMEVFSLFKIMNVAEMSFNIPKELLENWMEKIKNIFADAKIEFEQPEELISELETEPQTEESSKKKAFFEAISYEDFKNVNLLAAKMEIKSEDVPKFKALINSLLKNGLITSQDLNNAIAAMSSDDFENMGFLVAETETKSEDVSKIEIAFIRECIGEIWKLVKNDSEAEIKNLVNKTDSLIEEEVIGSAKEITYSSAKESVSGLAEEMASGLTKEAASGSAEEVSSGLTKEIASDSAEEIASDATKKIVSDSVKESFPGLTSGLLKKIASGSAEEFVSNLAKDINGKNTENQMDLEKVDLVKMYLELLKKKKKFLDEEENEEGEKELVAEEEKTDSEVENKTNSENTGKKSLAFEEEDLKLLDSFLDPKMANKNKHKGFRTEMQQASPAQPQQTLQIQPQQMRQTTQVQPETRAVWEGDGLRIELVNPKTGEKVQTLHEGMPQKMQERINEFEVVRQVVAQAKFITTPTGEQKMTVQLQPEHLGQVDLRITLNHGEMQIHARVESITAQSALETHIGLLREGLEKQGITLERLEVSVEQKDRQDAYSLSERQEHREQKHGNHRHHRGREQHLAISIARDDSSDTGRRLGYNTMEYLA